LSAFLPANVKILILMRILQISSARTYGGGERHVVDLCRGLQERGHDVFASLRPTADWIRRLDFLPPDNLFKVSIRNSFGVLSAIRIADFVRENKIDIIHAHVARDYIPASIASMSARNAKLVITRHVMFPLKPFNRFALKNVERAIAVSDAVLPELVKIFSAEKVCVIPNGTYIPPDDRDAGRKMRKEFREQYSLPQDAPVIGTLGELKALKGQHDLILAAAAVAKEIPACRFVVVGRDNTDRGEYRDQLKREAAELGIADKFVWLEWLEDTAPFHSAIDVFVSPSHSESFGLAILEAMAYGKPIVATETDGARHLIANCGCLVPIGDPAALASALIRVVRDPELCADHGAKARSVAETDFSLDRMIAQTESLYEEVLAAERAAAG
jgi:L-malate glycosyltransferase